MVKLIFLCRRRIQALAEGMFDSQEGERIIREDIARFIGRSAAYRVAEYPQR